MADIALVGAGFPRPLRPRRAGRTRPHQNSLPHPGSNAPPGNSLPHAPARPTLGTGTPPPGGSLMRSFLSALVVVAVTGLAPAADVRKPNVLILLADDVGWGEFGFQGILKDIPTPNIDTIAKNGV